MIWAWGEMFLGKDLAIATQIQNLRTLGKAKWCGHPMYSMKYLPFSSSEKLTEEKFDACTEILNDFYVKVKWSQLYMMISLTCQLDTLQNHPERCH